MPEILLNNFYGSIICGKILLSEFKPPFTPYDEYQIIFIHYYYKHATHKILKWQQDNDSIQIV